MPENRRGSFPTHGGERSLHGKLPECFPAVAKRFLIAWAMFFLTAVGLDAGSS